MLSATGEKFPMKAWDLNMQSLLNALELAKEKVIDKIFGHLLLLFLVTTQKAFPQQTIMEPSTVYGISKPAGERWCEYYQKYGVDVRSSLPRTHFLEISAGRRYVLIMRGDYYKARRRGQVHFVLKRTHSTYDVYGRCHSCNHRVDGSNCGPSESSFFYNLAESVLILLS